MSNVDFNSLLDTPVEEIKAKPPTPIGTYGFRIKSLENIVSSQKKTPGVQFNCVPFEAKDDVDQELLAEAGGLGEREMKTIFYLTPDALNMVKEFLTDTCGIEGSGKTLRALLAEAPGSTFLGVVTHEPAKSGHMYATIGKMMKYE